MNYLKSAVKGIVCGAFGAAAMSSCLHVRDLMIADETTHKIATAFVRHKITNDLQAFSAFEPRLVETAEKYLKEKNGVVCLPRHKASCHIDEIHETSLLLEVMDTALGICAESEDETLNDDCVALKAKLFLMFENEVPEPTTDFRQKYDAREARYNIPSLHA